MIDSELELLLNDLYKTIELYKNQSKEMPLNIAVDFLNEIHCFDPNLDGWDDAVNEIRNEVIGRIPNNTWLLVESDDLIAYRDNEGGYWCFEKKTRIKNIMRVINTDNHKEHLLELNGEKVMRDLILIRLKNNWFALVTESPIYTLDGEELERGLIVDNYQSEYAEFIEGGDQLFHELGEETLSRVYKTVGYTFEGIGVKIEENTFYKTDSDSKVIFSNDELLEILKEGSNYIVAKDEYDDYYIVIGGTKISCDEEILDAPNDMQFQLPNGDFIAFLSEEDKLLGPCNNLEILDKLYS